MTILTPKKIKSLARSCEIIAARAGFHHLTEDFQQYVYVAYLENPARLSRLRYMWQDYLLKERITRRKKQGAKRKLVHVEPYESHKHDNMRWVEQQFRIARFAQYLTGIVRRFYLDFYVYELPSKELLKKYKSLSQMSHHKARIVKQLSDLVKAGVEI